MNEVATFNSYPR